MDQVQRFLFENSFPAVRGEVIVLEECWQALLSHHDYPPVLCALLGEMAAAAVLLRANLKFEGTLIMQIYGDGPVSMVVVECQHDLGIRATAKYKDIPDQATLTQMVNAHGQGRFSITLDPCHRQSGQKPYQGIVPFSDQNGLPIKTMSEVLEHYMQHSEQLETRLFLAGNSQRASGILLQKMPLSEDQTRKVLSEQDADTWLRVCQLSSTLTAEELLNTTIDTLIHRLFWQEDIRLYAPQSVRFHCTCSRQKVGAMIQSLGEIESQDIVKEQGHIQIHCEFCRQSYMFDPVDVAQLFAQGFVIAEPDPESHKTH